MSASGFRAKQLTVVGLGLMGGSLARALRESVDGAIIGVDSNAATREYALQHKIVDCATDSLKDGVTDSDVVILAAPVKAILTMVNNRIGSYLRSNTLLIDIGSTKQDICAALGQLPIGVHAVGGHPMTGKESSGIEASDATLYQGKPFVLCPTRRTTPAARLRALGMVETLGCTPIEMEARRHDRLVAAISHLPYLLSAALVTTVAQEGDSDDAVWQLAAGGFRDTSRLAAQDVTMMGDILSTNTQAVATLLALFRAKLANIEAMLIDKKEKELADMLNPARQARMEWVARLEGSKNGTTNTTN
jgi:prephenate dehydrogenase